jgi:hypothetical protein
VEIRLWGKSIVAGDSSRRAHPWPVEEVGGGYDRASPRDKIGEGEWAYRVSDSCVASSACVPIY